MAKSASEAQGEGLSANDNTGALIGELNETLYTPDGKFKGFLSPGTIAPVLNDIAALAIDSAPLRRIVTQTVQVVGDKGRPQDAADLIVGDVENTQWRGLAATFAKKAVVKESSKRTARKLIDQALYFIHIAYNHKRPSENHYEYLRRLRALPFRGASKAQQKEILEAISKLGRGLLESPDKNWAPQIETCLFDMNSWNLKEFARRSGHKKQYVALNELYLDVLVAAGREDSWFYIANHYHHLAELEKESPVAGIAEHRERVKKEWLAMVAAEVVNPEAEHLERFFNPGYKDITGVYEESRKELGAAAPGAMIAAAEQVLEGDDFESMLTVSKNLRFVSLDLYKDHPLMALEMEAMQLRIADKLLHEGQKPLQAIEMACTIGSNTKHFSDGSNLKAILSQNVDDVMRQAASMSMEQHSLRRTLAVLRELNGSSGSELLAELIEQADQARVSEHARVSVRDLNEKLKASIG